EASAAPRPLLRAAAPRPHWPTRAASAGRQRARETARVPSARARPPAARRSHFGRCKGPFLEDRRIARRQQNDIALAQANVELLGQMQQHFARGLRAAGLEEAEMPCRDLGLACEFELTHAALAAPFAQVVASGFADGLHGRQSSPEPRSNPLPPG